LSQGLQHLIVCPSGWLRGEPHREPAPVLAAAE
jgi:hypothetical protein